MASLEGIIYTLQMRDRTKDRTVTKQKKTYHANTYTAFEYILMAVGKIAGARRIVPEAAEPYITALQKYFGFSTPEEASLLCAFFNLCDDSRIRVRDIADIYKVHSLDIMYYSDELDDLVRRQFVIRRKDSEGNTSYRITEEVVQQIRNGEMPHSRDVSGLNAMQFCAEIDKLLIRYSHSEMEQEWLEESIRHLLFVNQNLHIAKTLLKYELHFDDMLLLLVIMNEFVNKHDDNITRTDIEDYFDDYMLRHHCYFLETGVHTLMRMELVEHSCSDGQVSPTEWKLTEQTKQDLLKELCIRNAVNRARLTRYDEITKKKLFYNERVTKEVRLLHDLLMPRRMKIVLERMEKEGMRKGFTCIFYGAPGTGKTETVLQLARQTKRDIMLVDVPSIRSKWVGDTEKNIKRVFDNYRAAVLENPMHAPILLVNEADAILCKRNEGGVSGVDKMENAMQNVILQEMEHLEGIMIATTNLTGNLDAAFERRFLWKVEFEKPSPLERQHIWKSMLSGLTRKQALELAKRFDFSGGQIENIARKRIVSDILNNREALDINDVIESCRNELLNKRNIHKIGFK